MPFRPPAVAAEPGAQLNFEALTKTVAALEAADVLLGKIVAGRWGTTGMGGPFGPPSHYEWRATLLAPDANYLAVGNVGGPFASINIVRAGTYLFIASILNTPGAGVRGDVELRHGGTPVVNSLGHGTTGGYAKHTLPYLASFAANDYVQVTNTAGNTFADNGWSNLLAIRLGGG